MHNKIKKLQYGGSPYSFSMDYSKQFINQTQGNINSNNFKTGLALSKSSSPLSAIQGNSMLNNYRNSIMSSNINTPNIGDGLQAGLSGLPSLALGVKGVYDSFKSGSVVNTTTEGVKGATQTASNIGKAGNIAALAGAAFDILGGFLPEKTEYSGEKGDITQTADSIWDAASNTAMMFGPMGMIVGGAMKGVSFLGDAANAIGGGTDGMTTTDAILGSPLLNITPFGLINGFGGKNADTILRDDETYAALGSSYGGSYSQINDSLKKSGKKYGLFSRNAMRDANQEIQESKRQQSLMQSIYNDTQDRFSIRDSMSAINGNRRLYNMYGGYDQSNVRVGKNGIIIPNIDKAKSILSKKVKPNILEFQNGGSIVELCYTPTEILLVEDNIPQFQKGGQLNNKPRTLQELIQYAKEQNPRFIQRLSEAPRGIDFIDDEGKQSRGSHYLEWSTSEDGKEAIIYPRIQEVDNELKFFNSGDAYSRALENKNYLIMTPEEAKIFFAKDPEYGTAYKSGWPQFFNKFKEGGSINVIPEGALHARKHNMDMEGITKKGIPVVTEDDKGNIEQQAEIEKEEIIFRLEVTKKLEELQKKYYSEESTQKERDQYALEAGQLLVNEIIYNTVDNTNNLL